MSYAQIDLGFTKYSAPGGTEYMLNTVVNAATTTPTAVDTCLVVLKGDSSTEEELLRVATYGELVTTPLPVLPATIDVFSSASLPLATIGAVPTPTAILPGDEIIVTTPDLWQQFSSVGASVTYTVATVVSTTVVTVTPAFPAFARGLTFEVWRGTDRILPQVAPLVYPADGVATRDYSATPLEDHYLAASHMDSWTDLTVAENRVTSLKTEAESLITAMNTANWTGTEEVTYP